MLPLPNFIATTNNKQVGASANNINLGKTSTHIENSRHELPRKAWNGWCSQPTSLAYGSGQNNTPYPIKQKEKILSCDACCQTFLGDQKLKQHLSEHIKVIIS